MSSQYRNPSTIEAEISRDRDQIDHTIDSITQRFTRGEIIEQALNSMRGAGHFATNLGHSVQHNPLAVSLTGVGLAWLMMSGSQNGSQDTAADPMLADSTDSGPGTKDKVSAKARNAGGRVSSAAGSARDNVSRLQHGAQDRFGRVSDSSRSGARRMRNSVNQTWQEQPLVLGVVGIALGAALGAGLPATRREDELMGAARDDVARKAGEAGEEQLARARTSAEQARQDPGSDAPKHDGAKQDGAKQGPGSDYRSGVPS